MVTGPDPKVVPLHGRQPASSALPERTDDELMELAAAEVKAGFAELVRRHQARVRNYCLKWDPSRGDDLAQEVFLLIWNARHRYRPGGRFTVYLFTVVRNCCHNARRFRSRQPSREQVRAVLADGRAADQLDSLLAAERARRLHLEIARLPPKLKEAVLLRFGEGMSYADIASIAGAPEVTVRSRVFLGVKRLREELLG